MNIARSTFLGLFDHRISLLTFGPDLWKELRSDVREKLVATSRYSHTESNLQPRDLMPEILDDPIVHAGHLADRFRNILQPAIFYIYFKKNETIHPTCFQVESLWTMLEKQRKEGTTLSFYFQKIFKAEVIQVRKVLNHLDEVRFQELFQDLLPSTRFELWLKARDFVEDKLPLSSLYRNPETLGNFLGFVVNAKYKDSQLLMAQRVVRRGSELAGDRLRESTMLGDLLAYMAVRSAMKVHSKLVESFFKTLDADLIGDINRVLGWIKRHSNLPPDRLRLITLFALRP